jgi:hypothetical protein
MFCNPGIARILAYATDSLYATAKQPLPCAVHKPVLVYIRPKKKWFWIVLADFSLAQAAKTCGFLDSYLTDSLISSVKFSG